MPLFDRFNAIVCYTYTAQNFLPWIDAQNGWEHDLQPEDRAFDVLF